MSSNRHDILNVMNRITFPWRCHYILSKVSGKLGVIWKYLK